MATLSHPGALSPLPPALRLTVAGDWLQVPAEGAILRAEGRDRGPDTPSLVLDVLTQRPGTDPAVTLRALVDADRERRGFQEDPAFTIDLAGRSWTAVNVTWELTDGPAVALHLVTVLDRGEVQQAVVATGRAQGSRIEEDYAAIQDMAESLVLEVDA